jgi:hypothetical protein
MAEIYSRFIQDLLKQSPSVQQEASTPVNEEVPGDSNIPFQERPDYLAEQQALLAQSEAAPQLPAIPTPSEPFSLSSLKNSSSVKVSSPVSRLNNMPQIPEVQEGMEQPTGMVEPSPKVDKTADYQKRLQEAQADRKNQMNQAVLRTAGSGLLNAGLIYSGNQHRVQPGGAAHEELKRMENLGLEELDQELKLPTQVSASEKAKLELEQMQELNDPNSLTSQSLRTAIKEFLGEHISDDVLNRMTGPQLKNIAEEVGALRSTKFKEDTTNKQLDLAERQFADQSARGWAEFQFKTEQAMNKELNKKDRSIYEENLERELAKNSGEWHKTRTELMANRLDVKHAINLMRDKNGKLWNFSGPMYRLTSEGTRKILTPKAAEIENALKKSIQSTLRPTLGAQFTEKEGERIMNFTFDTHLRPEENERRAKILFNKLDAINKTNSDFQAHMLAGGRVKDFDFQKHDPSITFGGAPDAFKGETRSGTSQPKTVRQNGVTYTLNEETGQYE